MSTEYPEIFTRLMLPFRPNEVKTRPGVKGMMLNYITARTAMNRLDEVLGPENWQDEYFETKDGLKCRLMIRLPDGYQVTKEDGGGFAPMQDDSDTEKSGFSEAFKRAAVKFGVGRYLYRDGVPSFVELPLPAPKTPLKDIPEGITEDEAMDRLVDQTAVPTIPREPGSDDISEIDGDIKKDGRWLFPRVERHGHTAWYKAFGYSRGFPKLIVQWSPKMVSEAIAARKKMDK